MIREAWELVDEGRLTEAVEALRLTVRRHPAEALPRNLLCELLLFEGDLAAAEAQFQALQELEPDAGRRAVVGLLRGVLHAELARRAFWRKGEKLPVPLGDPEVAEVYRTVCGAWRDGALRRAGELSAAAEGQRQRPEGTLDGLAASDLRDQDDRLAGVLELLLGDGSYCWTPFSSLRSLTLDPPRRLLHLFWRRSRVGLADGRVFLGYVPVLYPGTHANADPRVRLGRVTQWDEPDGALRLGVGQRVLCLGEGDRAVAEIKAGWTSTR